MTAKSLFGLRILVELFPDEIVETESGIQLDTHSKFITKPKKGKVFLVGGEVNNFLKEKEVEPLNIGDVVLYERAEYQVINSDNKDYELITVHPLICVV